MTHAVRFSLVALVAVLVALVAGCSGPSPLDAPDAGRSAAYEPGLPSFDLEALATLDDGQPGLDVVAAFPRASLVFTAADSVQRARYELSVRVKDGAGRETVAFASFADTLVAPPDEPPRPFERVQHRRRFDLPAGTYLVEAALEDAETGETAIRQQRLDAAPPGEGARLSRVRLFDGDEPFIARHVPARTPLEARVEVYGAPDGATLGVVLARLTADTTIARPPFWVSASRGSLVFRGVDPDDADTLRVETDLLLGPDAEQVVTTELPALAPGVYRIDYALRIDGAVLDRQERTVSVKGIGFPRLATLAELVEALDYIAYDRELAFITDGATPQERRRRFDAFWGALVDDRRVAANLLRLYYERVEEANLLFTSVKPGWKTDRGMVYVVFGAPDYVEETFDGQVWHYGYGGPGDVGPFVFERLNYYGTRDPFGRYLLVRQPAYERAWTRAVERWRRGEAL